MTDSIDCSTGTEGATFGIERIFTIHDPVFQGHLGSALFKDTKRILEPSFYLECIQALTACWNYEDNSFKIPAVGAVRLGLEKPVMDESGKPKILENGLQVRGEEGVGRAHLFRAVSFPRSL